MTAEGTSRYLYERGWLSRQFGLLIAGPVLQNDGFLQVHLWGEGGTCEVGRISVLNLKCAASQSSRGVW
jgi:hypothetical protein